MTRVPKVRSFPKKVRGRTAGYTDVLVGKRLLLKRKLMGLSQQALADKIGVSFQQVQKYEKGSNRISAGKLEHIAAALDVPIEFFFKVRKAETGTHNNIVCMLNDPENVSLLIAFTAVTEAGLRKAIIRHVRTLSRLKI